MKLPETWNVYGLEVPIKYVPEMSTLAGFYDPKSKSITIYKHECEKELIATILHELGHAWMDRLGIAQAIPLELQEVISEGFSRFVTESFDIKL